MEDPFQKFIAERISDSLNEYYDWLEALVEDAIQGGMCGVMVVHHDGYTDGRVDPSVPYGEIHEHGVWTPKVVLDT